MIVELNWAAVAIFVTILGAILGMAIAWGTLREKVRQNRIDIDNIRDQNRTDHALIFQKLDALLRCIVRRDVSKDGE